MSTRQVHVEERVGVGNLLVRFRDDEILEGTAASLDFDRPEFAIEVIDPGANNRSAVVPLASVKSVMLDRRELGSQPNATRLHKVAIHYWDGEVVKGLLAEEPRRHAHAMTFPLVSPALDEVEVLGIPYTAVKALYYVKSWDSRGAEYVRETGRWTTGRADTPLLDLLGEIRGLTSLRERGHLSDVEFEKRRREVLERI